MFTAVLILNGILAIVCFWIAWTVWQYRKALTIAADSLIEAEKNTYQVLHGAPEAILQGQIGARQLRQGYRQLTVQMRQVRGAIALISLGQTLWQGRSGLPLLPGLKLRPKLSSPRRAAAELEKRAI
jgi:hypothetical protein